MSALASRMRLSLRELLGSRMFALHPDGLRVPMAPPTESDTVSSTHFTLMLNPFATR